MRRESVESKKERRTYKNVRERTVFFPRVFVVFAHHAVDVELVVTYGIHVSACRLMVQEWYEPSPSKVSSSKGVQCTEV